MMGARRLTRMLTIAVLAAGGAMILVPSRPVGQTAAFDLVIRGGHIVDGIGGTWANSGLR